MEEIWKDIPTCPNYQVSNFGRVRSLKFNRIRILKPRTYNKLGHQSVMICNKDDTISRTIHSLVLEAFVGPRPEGMVIRHLDSNPSNNHLDNLCYGTPRENNIDCVLSNHHKQRKLSVDDVKEIRKLLEEKTLTQDEIAEMFNVGQDSITGINTGKYYKYVR